METIDLDRCLRAMDDINVEGQPRATGKRGEAIADAISNIQCDGTKVLIGCYIGVKNYAAFGDQREDHRYGTGPRHGSIVFRIARCCQNGERPWPMLGDDHIYLLECVRDFSGLDEPNPQYPNSLHTKHLNLCDVLREREKLLVRLGELNDALGGASVETHACEENAP